MKHTTPSMLLVCLLFLGTTTTLQAIEPPTGNPADFKVKTCLHSVSYAGVWRGQERLTVDAFLEKARELGYDGVMLMAKRPHVSPLDYGDAARKALRQKIEDLGLKLVSLAG